jgi:hypothetical protein
MDRSYHRSLFQRKPRDGMALGPELRRIMSRDFDQALFVAPCAGHPS